MENLILEEIVVVKNIVEYKFSITKGLEHYFNTKKLVVEYGVDLSDVPVSILTIPFVACLIPITWLTNSVMWVKELDKTFYDSIPRIKYAYQDLYPHYPLEGRFVAARMIPTTFEVKKEALLLFSGGVDAHSSYIRNKEKRPLLCNIQGWYKELENNDLAAEADERDIAQFALGNDLDFEYVRSNFATIINTTTFNKKIGVCLRDSWWHGFQHSMAFISIAIPIAYLYGIKEIIIASSFTIGDERVCASYATTDSEFYFSTNGHTTHDGFELNRQDKIRVIVNYQRKINKPYPIRVCSFNEVNCCKCEKCFRTILGIVAENGNVSDFDFHIDPRLTLKEHFEQVMCERLALYGIENERISHWSHIRKRMLDNYANIYDKEFVNWFIEYDFVRNKKRALIKYYYTNFYSIVLRKIRGLGK